ncbi:lipoprotein [Spiroplasma endosymbiont of Panorpa germanica]|uniref:lipoprotein n=1 Tax=Spiroplasma endosymbiont of Panorpa germanica TaxID=3066314 RepID=UPI0030CE8D1F
MKKLLVILGSVSLLTSTSATVVACNANSRITEATLNDKILRSLLASVFGDKHAAAMDFGDIFNSGDLQSSLINIINRMIAQNNYFRATNNLYDSLGLGKNTEEVAFRNYQTLNNSIATDKLYTDYTKSISGAATTQALDYSIRRQSYSLNAQDLKLEVGGEEKVYANVGVKLPDGKLWSIRNELATSDYSESIPTAKTLSGDGFSLVDISEGTSSPKAIAGYDNLTGKEALKYRFKDWFENEIQSKIIENLLSISRQIPEAFRVAAGPESNKKTAYFNRYSAIGKYSQTWNNSSTPWTSNIKMVWEFTVKNTNFGKVKTALESLDIDQNSGVIKSDKNIADNIAKFNTAIGDANLSEDGNDPYFSQPGFKGFISIKDGEIYGTNNLATDFTYKTSLVNASEPGVIGENGHLYFQGAKSDEISVVFVLPVYLIQLLQDYEIQRDPEGEAVKLNLGPSISSPNQYQDVWNQEQNLKKHSKDIEELDANLKQDMINQFHYIVSQNEDVLKESKTSLYSIYLDADDILYSGLWDSISKYIKDEDE